MVFCMVCSHTNWQTHLFTFIISKRGLKEGINRKIIVLSGLSGSYALNCKKHLLGLWRVRIFQAML